jgi:hypothetical protein
MIGCCLYIFFEYEMNLMLNHHLFQKFKMIRNNEFDYFINVLTLLLTCGVDSNSFFNK